MKKKSLSKNFLFLILIIVLIDFVSCRKINKVHNSVSSDVDLQDVPLVIGAHSINKYPDTTDKQECRQIQYKVPVTASEIASFYCYEMDRIGWQLYDDYYGHDIVLHFKKPHERCCIILQAIQDTYSMITIMHKTKIM